jgi:MFS family permease
MADIFISYANQDRDRVKHLAEALENQGWSVWFDRAIPPGMTFDQVIEEAINAARCVLVLWSKISIKSDWVKEEANIGKERKILIPAKIDAVEPPLGFGRIQAADLIDWKTEKSHVGFKALLSAISGIVVPSVQKEETEQVVEISVSNLEQQPETRYKESETLQHEDRGATPSRYAWVILSLVCLVAFCNGLIHYKVSPFTMSIMEKFDVNMRTIAQLSSVFYMTLLILALPAGIITQRMGLKITGTIALGLITMGTVLGAMSGSFGLLLFSRFVDGIGAVLIAVLAPAAIAMWFPSKKTGAPMGFYFTAFLISGAVTSPLAPTFESSIGWTGVWWFVAGFTFLWLLVYWLFMRPALAFKSTQEDRPNESPERFSLLKGSVANKNLLLLSLAMMVFSASFSSLIAYYPIFLSMQGGMTMRASMIIIIILVSGAIIAPLAGLVSDTIGSRKWVILAGFIIFLPVFPLSFHVSGGMITFMAILLGVVSGMIQPVIFAAIPEALNSVKLSGIGMGVLVLGVNLGSIVGLKIFSFLVDWGWTYAVYLFIPVILAGVIFVSLYKKIAV